MYGLCAAQGLGRAGPALVFCIYVVYLVYMGYIWIHSDVFGYDYSGYGEASGTPSEKNTYADINAAYDYLAKNFCENPAKDIILYGQSVGSGPSLKLATTKKRPVRGLVLHRYFCI